MRFEGSWLPPLSRRRLMQLTGASGLGVALGGGPLLARGLRAADMVEELTIDLSSEPANLDPATTYEADGWSIVHSIYDAPVQYGPDGTLEMVIANSMTWVDPTTLDIELRSGVMFHDGEPLTAESIAYSVNAIQTNDASQIAGNFATIETVEVVDDLTARLTVSPPSPWLPAQMAAWLALLPPAYASNNDFRQRPVGTGPYRFVEWAPGERITLEANESYPSDSPKGTPIAKRVHFRFVGEPSTRVADLLSGSSQLIRGVPIDQEQSVIDAGAQVIVTPLSGVSFIRIPTDQKPFDDVRVRQALNYAIDVDVIIETLLGGHGTRLANVFVDPGLGYDPALAPFAYDPERARALLTEAGVGDGFETAIDVAATERTDVIEAIAAQLGEVGIETKVNAVEVATFNQTWTDPAAPPLRFVTWRPVFDPYTLISLIFSNQGFLSRHDNPTVQPLIDSAAAESDPATRAATYVELGKALNTEPGAIYLWSLTALYGAAADAPAWSPRADDYMLPTVRG